MATIYKGWQHLNGMRIRWKNRGVTTSVQDDAILIQFFTTDEINEPKSLQIVHRNKVAETAIRLSPEAVAALIHSLKFTLKIYQDKQNGNNKTNG